VCISATTLERNRHGLFDREAPPEQRHHQSMVVPLLPTGPSLQFVRCGSEVRLLQGKHAPTHSAASSPLHTQLAWRGSGGSLGKGLVVERTPVSASRCSASRKVMWLGIGEKGHALKEGELIKLGSFTLSVRQVCLKGVPQVPRFSSHRDPETALVRQEAPSLERDCNSALCRICLGGPGHGEGDEEDEGPLILAPCLCRGNVQRVHLNCLRHWLSVRYSVENRMQGGAIALSFKPPGCEICRTEFPATYQNPYDPEAEPVPLLDSLPLVEPPFIVLAVPKSSGEDRERPHGERCVFAPCGRGDAVLRVGRQRDTELRLNDSSVSRVHALIRYQSGRFMLYDNNARFRTLVLPTGPEPLRGRPRAEPLSVQAGRTLLSFALLEDMAEMDAPGAPSAAMADPDSYIDEDGDVRRLGFGSISQQPPTPEPEEQELQDPSGQQAPNADIAEGI